MIGEVIRNIRNNIIRAFSRPDFHVQIRQEGDDFPVNSDTATSAALVINELALRIPCNMPFGGESRAASGSL